MPSKLELYMDYFEEIKEAIWLANNLDENNYEIEKEKLLYHLNDTLKLIETPNYTDDDTSILFYFYNELINFLHDSKSHSSQLTDLQEMITSYQHDKATGLYNSGNYLTIYSPSFAFSDFPKKVKLKSDLILVREDLRNCDITDTETGKKILEEAKRNGLFLNSQSFKDIYLFPFIKERVLGSLNKYIGDINSSIEECILYNGFDDDDDRTDDSKAGDGERDFWRAWNDGNLDMLGYGK